MPYAMFTDDTHVEVVGYFACPQIDNPNSAEIPTWDLRWKIYIDKNPSLDQEITEKWEHPSADH